MNRNTDQAIYRNDNITVYFLHLDAKNKMYGISNEFIKLAVS
jgi:hypothetical protein